MPHHPEAGDRHQLDHHTKIDSDVGQQAYRDLTPQRAEQSDIRSSVDFLNQLANEVVVNYRSDSLEPVVSPNDHFAQLIRNRAQDVAAGSGDLADSGPKPIQVRNDSRAVLRDLVIRTAQTLMPERGKTIPELVVIYSTNDLQSPALLSATRELEAILDAMPVADQNYQPDPGTSLLHTALDEVYLYYVRQFHEGKDQLKIALWQKPPAEQPDPAAPVADTDTARPSSVSAPLSVGRHSRPLPADEPVGTGQHLPVRGKHGTERPASPDSAEGYFNNLAKQLKAEFPSPSQGQSLALLQDRVRNEANVAPKTLLVGARYDPDSESHIREAVAQAVRETASALESATSAPITRKEIFVADSTDDLSARTAARHVVSILGAHPNEGTPDPETDMRTVFPGITLTRVEEAKPGSSEYQLKLILTTTAAP